VKRALDPYLIARPDGRDIVIRQNCGKIRMFLYIVEVYPCHVLLLIRTVYLANST
jgi:hypothetical protein